MTTTDPDSAPGQVIPGTPTQHEPGADVLFTHRQILVILSGLMSGMLLAALDMTIVSTSIRTIADDLNGLSLQAWATTAYLITSTIATPLYGKLSDLYGRRPFFITAISVFVLGSLLSGFATTMYQLAAFRAVQGIGAGGLFSLALAIIGDIVPPRERARYQGYMLAVFGSASVLGPLVGGFFAGQGTLLGVTGWRWVFLINVPIGALALVLVARVLHLPHTRRDHAIDWPGAVALTICLVPLLLVAEQGRSWGWTSGGAIACYAVGALGLVLFLASERYYADDALLPLRLFTGKTFAIGSLMNLFIGMGMFGGMAALPLYLQIVRGHTPTESGLLMLPLTAGVMSGSVLSGQFIARTGRYKIFPVMGCMLLVTGMLLFSLVHVDTTIWAVAGISVVFGLGLGFNMQTLVLAIQNAVPPQDMGVATGSATFFRQMGGTLGTAVFLSVLFSTVGGNIKDAIGSAVKANPSLAPDFAKLQGSSLDDSSFINKLSDQLAAPFKKGFTDSIDLVFSLGAAVLVVALITVFFLPEEPLRTKSGLAARQDADRENAEAAKRGASS